MRVLVLGASRGTGASCVTEALGRGHQVTAFSRSGSPQPSRPGLTDVRGSFHDAAQVKAAVAGQEAVIITASASGLGEFRAQPDWFSLGTRLAVQAMQQHGVRRLVVLSALGVGESRAATGRLLRLLVIDGVLRVPFADHEVQERVARDSGLDWVIARPGRLTDGPARRRYQQRSDLQALPSSIARADVADFLVGACERRELVGRAWQLGG